MDLWNEMANECAEDACENHFSTRRAVWPIEGAEIVVYVDNNPYADDPTRRPRELQGMRDWLAARGFAVLAEASYPPPGAEDAGYTCALVLHIAPHAVPALVAVMEAVVAERPDRLN